MKIICTLLPRNGDNVFRTSCFTQHRVLKPRRSHRATDPGQQLGTGTARLEQAVGGHVGAVSDAGAVGEGDVPLCTA